MKRAIIILIFLVYGYPGSSQIPDELKGKWIGEIKIVKDGDSATGYASIAIGSFLATKPIDVEVEANNFDKPLIKNLYSWFPASFGISGKASDFKLEGYIQLSSDKLSRGQFNFQSLSYMDNAFLYGVFKSPETNLTVAITLFKKSFVKSLPKNGKRAILPDAPRLS
jgi:hypothetical protein